MAERRRDNRMAGAYTTAAREEYVNVLRPTVRRYGRNLHKLGEMAGIKVEAELPPLADDESSPQPGRTGGDVSPSTTRASPA